MEPPRFIPSFSATFRNPLPRRATIAACLAPAVLASLPGVAPGEVKPAMLFSDHMVLQRDRPIRVWGEGAAGEKLSVSIGRSKVSGTVGSDGKWRVELPAMKADGKPHTLTIASAGGETEFEDILIGEVWFLAGQSNMAAGMGGVGDTVEDLRLMSIDHNRVYGWHVATPDNVAKMPWTDGSKRWRSVSHVAYHFGRHLQEKLGVPVGVMHADHGGSVIAAWMTDTVKTDWPELPGGKPVTGDLRTLVGNLFRYKVKKAAPLNVGGTVWWQGESDGGNAKYGDNLQSMVATWREQFEQPEMPFIAIQIAPNTFAGGPLLVWEAQTWATKNVDGFYLAPNQDAWVGHSKGVDGATGWPTSGGNPHPPAKDQAARRAADVARQLIGDEVGHEVFGPSVIDHKARGDKFYVKFEHVGDGLKARDGEPLTWFEISDGTEAGGGLKYVKAEAKIFSKDVVELSAPGVDRPVHARYGWSPLAMTNLVNSAGLPAVTFRTDLPEK